MFKFQPIEINCFAFLFEQDAYTIFKDYARIRKIVETKTRKINIPAAAESAFFTENKTTTWTVLGNSEEFESRCAEMSCYDYSIRKNAYCNSQGPTSLNRYRTVWCFKGHANFRGRISVEK